MRADDVVGAIEASVRAAQATFPLGPVLHRGHRALHAWREALHARVMGGADFRAIPLRRDDLEAALVQAATDSHG